VLGNANILGKKGWLVICLLRNLALLPENTKYRHTALRYGQKNSVVST